jgi:DNA recombination protein RmuC
VIGAALGAGICFLILRERVNAQSKQIASLEPLREDNARLRASEGELRGRVGTLELARETLVQTFAAASTQVLHANAESFLNLAGQRFKTLQSEASGEIDQLVLPMRETLKRVEQQVNQVERERINAYASLNSEVRNLGSLAHKLSTALATPTARGRWGEVQLRRVVEMAGMSEHCDFSEQVTLAGEDARLRPDLIIKLPNDRQIVVDSKVPLTSYMAACECTDEQVRGTHLEAHARQVRDHLRKLGTKAYAAQLSFSPEFVVAFLPGEVFFSAALQADPELLEFGVQNNVILATPTTLIALLKAVAYGWRQEQITRSAVEIRDLGAQLHDRIRVFSEYYEKVGASLRSALGAYEKGRQSMETRLLATARKFEELGVARSSPLPEPLPLLDLALAIEDETRTEAGRA